LYVTLSTTNQPVSVLHPRPCPIQLSPPRAGLLEGVALEVPVVAGLQLNGAGHALEVALPGLVADDH